MESYLHKTGVVVGTLFIDIGDILSRSKDDEYQYRHFN